MDLRQLRALVAVADAGGFTQAAEQLHIAQSAVSVAIRKLETQLGLALFDRSERKPRLTAEGEALYQHARRLLSQFEQTEQAMQDLKGRHRGRVRLGTSAMLGSYFLPGLIREFRRVYPKIHFEVTGEGTASARDRLLRGDIDMAVVNLRDLPTELEACPLMSDSLVACVAPDHPLAHEQALTVEQLLSLPLILYGRGYYLRDWLEHQAVQVGLQPEIVLETNLLRLVSETVGDGWGAALTLKLMADAEPAMKGLPLVDAEPLTLGIAWRRDRYLSLANRTFVEFCTAFAAGQ